MNNTNTLVNKEEISDMLKEQFLETFEVPKNLLNLIGKEVAKELEFDEGTIFDVSHSLTTDLEKLLITFTATVNKAPLAVIFYFSKKPSSNWWLLEDKFRMKSNKAQQIIDTIELGGEVKLTVTDDSEIITLEILSNGEVLFWQSY